LTSGAIDAVRPAISVALGLALLLDRADNAPSGSVRANNESLPKCSQVTGQMEEPWLRRYEVWLSEINEIGFDIRDLPQTELLVFYPGQELRGPRQHPCYGNLAAPT
jgi:hypothetical protein